MCVSIYKIYIAHLYLCICVCNIGLFSVDNAESWTKSNPIKSRICPGPLAHQALQPGHRTMGVVAAHLMQTTWKCLNFNVSVLFNIHLYPQYQQKD